MKRLIFALTCALPLPALAESYVCQYKEECVGIEACQHTDWEVWLGTIDGGDLLMSSEAGEKRFIPLSQEDGYRAFFSPASLGEVALMTLSPDLMIAVSIMGLYDGAERLSYAGVCQPE